MDTLLPGPSLRQPAISGPLLRKESGVRTPLFCVLPAQAPRRPAAAITRTSPQTTCKSARTTTHLPGLPTKPQPPCRVVQPSSTLAPRVQRRSSARLGVWGVLRRSGALRFGAIPAAESAAWVHGTRMALLPPPPPPGADVACAPECRRAAGRDIRRRPGDGYTA